MLSELNFSFTLNNNRKINFFEREKRSNDKQKEQEKQQVQ